MRKFIIIIIAVAMLPLMVTAQSQSGEFLGTVVQEDGSRIPGVLVTLTSNTIGQRTTLSNGKGNFRFINLSSGIYNFKYELEGFDTDVIQNVELSMGKTHTLELFMKPSTGM